MNTQLFIFLPVIVCDALNGEFMKEVKKTFIDVLFQELFP